MTSILLRELTGAGRALTLRERALPDRDTSGFTVIGGHEIVEMRALGSPTTTQQPTGAVEKPTSLSGTWSDFYLGSNSAWFANATETVIDGYPTVVIDESAVTSARELCDIVDDFRKRASLLRVSWLHLSRVGRISEFRQVWRTPHDVEWSIEFAWVGQDEPEGEAVPETIDPYADVRALTGAADAVGEAISYAAIAEMDPGYLQRIDNRLAAAQSAIIDAEDAVVARLDGISSATQVFQRGLAAMRLLRDEAEFLALTIDAQVAGATMVVPDPEDLTSLAPGRVLAVLTQSRIAARSARALKETAVRRRYDNLRAVEEVAAIYIARAGDDLQSIALAHYGPGAGEAWKEIRDFNQFTSGSVAPGTIVLVPTRGARAA